ncbi:MAG TPA: TIM44-like domain-containing protein [Hansschlegelia sp.]
MRSRSIVARIPSVAIAAFVAAMALAPLDADARAGRSMSFGSRGSKTFSAPPPTATMPGAAPIQRSITQPGAAIGAPSAMQPARRGFFGGGLGAGLMGGLLGAGLFGLLAGNGLFGGLGSLSSVFGLLLQIGLIFIAVRFVMSWLARRNAQPSPAAAGGPSNFGFSGFGGGSRDRPDVAPQPAAPLTLEKADFDVFERMLSEVQAAWSGEDLGRMRAISTPEMVETFADDLAEDASRGVVNRVRDVKLLQGDLAEAWREGGRDYASVAMRYSLIDLTEDRATGRIVDGDPQTPIEATELWTFVRSRGGNWLLSAIQQTG